jgi:hypothetical protein
MFSKDLKTASKRLGLLSLMAGRYMDDDQDFIIKYSRITECSKDEAMVVLDQVKLKKVDRESLLNIALMGYTSEDIRRILNDPNREYLIYLILKLRICK